MSLDGVAPDVVLSGNCGLHGYLPDVSSDVKFHYQFVLTGNRMAAPVGRIARQPAEHDVSVACEKNGEHANTGRARCSR